MSCRHETEQHKRDWIRFSKDIVNLGAIEGALETNISAAPSNPSLTSRTNTGVEKQEHGAQGSPEGGMQYGYDFFLQHTIEVRVAAAREADP